MKNVYDYAEFFCYYQDLRKNKINANNLIENPIMKNFLPDVKDKVILDLGCGDGNMDKYFVDNGAKRVVATDISTNMIQEAKKENAHKNIEYLVLAMENLSTLKEKFDIVYSSLAFHYIKDFNKLLNDIYNLLKPSGILVFSQESPINTATIEVDKNFDNKIEVEGKRYYLLSDYCNEGERNNYWSGVPVTKYHRTYSSIVNCLISNNFQIIQMQDSFASEEAIKLRDKYKYQKDKPYFTFVKARKA